MNEYSGDPEELMRAINSSYEGDARTGDISRYFSATRRESENIRDAQGRM